MVWWIRLLVCMQIFHSSNSPVVTDFVIQNKISSTTPSKFAVKIFNIEVLNNAHNNLEKDYKLLFLEKKCYSIIVLTWIMPHLRLPLSLFPHKDCPPPFPSPHHHMMKKKLSQWFELFKIKIPDLKSSSQILRLIFLRCT